MKKKLARFQMHEKKQAWEESIESTDSAVKEVFQKDKAIKEKPS